MTEREVFLDMFEQINERVRVISERMDKAREDHARAFDDMVAYSSAIEQNMIDYIEMSIKHVERYSIHHGYPFKARMRNDFKEVESLWASVSANDDMLRFQGKEVNIVCRKGMQFQIEGCQYWFFAGFVDGASIYELNDCNEEV